MEIMGVRRVMGINQRDLANLAGINKTRMHRLECGHNLMNIQELIKLREISNLFTDDVLKRMSKETP